MPYKYIEPDGSDILEVKYTGIVTAEDHKGAINEFKTINETKKYFLVLTDLIEMEIAPSVLNIYDNVNLLEQIEIDKAISEAIILPENKFAAENVRFYENACVNRGFNVKTFNERDKALSWLKKQL